MATRRYIRTVFLTIIVSLFVSSALAQSNDTLTVHPRSRISIADNPGAWQMTMTPVSWKSSETAVVICDMWDQHWCKSATARVSELAGPMNEIVTMARSKGMMIIHSPSECMDAYKDHPARKTAMAATTGTVPDFLGKWNSKLDKETAPWPVDQSDGGCDCDTPCKQGNPWRKQIDTIYIDPQDIISDNGLQIGRILEQRGIRNVIVMGVHTNMCVVGRPFGARNLARWGKNVVIMRDMTDTMYNPKMSPKVNHFAGTSVVLEHIEKFICPTIASTDLTDKPPFRFSSDKRPKVVFVMAENEYRADQCLPEFARLLENHYDLTCDFAAGVSLAKGPNVNQIENLQTLADADLGIIYRSPSRVTRRTDENHPRFPRPRQGPDRPPHRQSRLQRQRPRSLTGWGQKLRRLAQTARPVGQVRRRGARLQIYRPLSAKDPKAQKYLVAVGQKSPDSGGPEIRRIQQSQLVVSNPSGFRRRRP